MNYIARNWLKYEKGGKSQFPTKLKRIHFKDQFVEIKVLLHHFVGKACTNSFEFSMCHLILVICAPGNLLIGLLSLAIICMNNCGIFMSLAFHMCSYLIFILASQEYVWPRLELHHPLLAFAPIYHKFSPHHV